MRFSKPIAAFLLYLALWITPALADPVNMRDQNLVTTSTQDIITTLQPFTAPRTLTIPGRGALSAYFIQFADTANAVNGSNVLNIRTADGSLINGASTLTLNQSGVYLFIIPNPTGYYAFIGTSGGGGGGTNPGGISGQIQWNSSGFFAGFTASGDATITPSTGAVVVTSTNGAPFGTAATQNTGTSGSTLPFLNGNNTWSGTNTFGTVLGTITSQSGTSYTLATSDCGTQVNFTAASTVTVTIPSTLTPGCNIVLLQAGAGQVVVTGSAVTPATLHSAHAYTGTSAQWAMIGINMEAATIAILTGDGA